MKYLIIINNLILIIIIISLSMISNIKCLIINDKKKYFNLFKK